MAKQDSKKKMENPAPALIKAVGYDIFVRHWVVTALALLLVASAIVLAQTSHQSRSLTAKLQAEKKRQQILQIQWESLRLELTTLTEADRISSQAKKQLNMQEVTVENEKVISL